MAYEAGVVSPSKADMLTLRDVQLLYQGYLRREKKSLYRFIGLRNDIRAIVDGEQIDPDTLFSSTSKTQKDDSVEMDAMKYRWSEWFEEDVSDNLY